jgi:hypothetical protein
MPYLGVRSALHQQTTSADFASHFLSSFDAWRMSGVRIKIGAARCRLLEKPASPRGDVDPIAASLQTRERTTLAATSGRALHRS